MWKECGDSGIRHIYKQWELTGAHLHQEGALVTCKGDTCLGGGQWITAALT